MSQKPGGLVEVFGPLGITEMHASTCAHCQHITTFEGSARQMHKYVDICRNCMKPVCIDERDPHGNIVRHGCAGKPCDPWERNMERQEQAYRENLPRLIDEQLARGQFRNDFERLR